MSFRILNTPLHGEAVDSLANYRTLREQCCVAEFASACESRLRRMRTPGIAADDLVNWPRLETYLDDAFDPASWPNDLGSTWHVLQLATCAMGGVVVVPDTTLSIAHGWKRFTDVISGYGITGLPQVALVRGYPLFSRSVAVLPNAASMASIALVVSLPGNEPTPALLPVVDDHDIEWVARWSTQQRRVGTLWVAPRDEHMLPASIHISDMREPQPWLAEGASIKFRIDIRKKLDRLLPRWVPPVIFDSTLGDVGPKTRRARIA